MHEPTPNERTIATLLAEVTPEQQAVFDVAYYTQLAEQLAEAEQHEPFDPDAAEAEMIRIWRAGCNNERLPDDDPQAPLPGYTVPVWVSPAGTVMTYTLDRLPAPVLKEERAPVSPRRLPPQLALLGGLAALVFAVGGWRMLATPAPASVTEASVPSATAEAVTPSTAPTPISDARTTAELADPVSLELGEDGTQVWRVVRSDGALGNPWTPPLATGTAAWLGDSVINPILCFPHADAATLRELQRGDPLTLRLASGIARTYAVLRVAQVGRQEIERFDQHALRITLAACGTSGNDRTVVEALYQIDRRGLPPEPARDRVSLPEWITLERDTLQIDATDTGARVQLTVRITNTSGANLTLADLQGQLLLNGIAYASTTGDAPSVLANEATHPLTITATVPSAARGHQVVWQTTLPDGQHALLLVGTLDW